MIALQTAVEALLSDVHRGKTLADYYSIPANTADGFCDIKLIQVSVSDGTHEPFQTDICICRNKGSQSLYVDFIGDARGVHGFVEHEARQLTLPGLVKVGEAAEPLLQLLGLSREDSNR